jgi:enamine deaminase RidA (YjgF/YER057c/UK114 family)
LGGFDFCVVPCTNVSNDAFQKDFAQLPAAVSRSVSSPVTGDGGLLWLGGQAPPDPQRNGVAAAREAAAQGRMVLYTVVAVIGAIWLITVVIVVVVLRRRRRNRLSR